MATKKTEAEAEDSEGEEPEEGAKKGKSKLILIAGAVVLLLAIGGGLMASGVLGGGDKKEEEAATEESAHAKGGKGVAKPVYYELPEFLVNLSSSTARVSFLKMSVTLELRDQEAVALVEANKPRIIDTFNTYLREMRPTDLNGSAGIHRLRDELMTRINKTIEEGLVKDILFSEIIVQ
ncbi:MAG: flagellar basal body-associated FliL family protein [Alphaproteobacteria bacterium]|nr:flagellar basal body-associated FliL family protein [Alphaproteobacteria bacterium]